jgi:Trk-type K+ transport system membrane component
MTKHLKFVLFIVAIALIALLILYLKKEVSYAKAESVKNLAEREILGIKLLDIFLGALAVAAVGITAGYVLSIVKGSPKPSQEEASEAPAPEDQPPPKVGIEKALGRKGAKILGIILITILILVVLAIALILVSPKLPFLRDILEKIG